MPPPCSCARRTRQALDQIGDRPALQLRARNGSRMRAVVSASRASISSRPFTSCSASRPLSCCAHASRAAASSCVNAPPAPRACRRSAASAAALPLSKPLAWASSIIAARLAVRRRIAGTPCRRRPRVVVGVELEQITGDGHRTHALSRSPHPLLEDGRGLLLVEVDHLLEPLQRRAPELLGEVRDQVGLRLALAHRRLAAARRSLQAGHRAAPASCSAAAGSLPLASRIARMAGRRPNQISSAATPTMATALTMLPSCPSSCSTMPGEPTGSSGWPPCRKSTAETVMWSPRLASMPAARVDQALDLLQLLVDGLRPGAVAERRQQPLAVDHHGDGQLVDLVALADGRGGLGADLVVGELLAALVGALRLVAGGGAACSAGTFCSTPTAVRVLTFCELPVSLTTRTERSTRYSGL